MCTEENLTRYAAYRTFTYILSLAILNFQHIIQFIIYSAKELNKLICDEVRRGRLEQYEWGIFCSHFTCKEGRLR